MSGNQPPPSAAGAGAQPDSAPSIAAARLARDVVFVLVQPQHPGNVGAVARAMKNMGLRRLIVVDPPPSFDLERARWMAPGAADVLEQARIVATLDEALADVHYAVATTARHRTDGQAVLEPPELARRVFDHEDGHVTAVLFGREDDGLSRADVARCAALVRIATDHHASLNLGQASLLVSHHLFETARAHGLVPDGRIVSGRNRSRSTRALEERRQDPLASLRDVEPAVLELVELLNRVGYTRASNPDRVAVTLRESIQHAGLTKRQVAALRGMTGRIGFALDNPDVDWRASRREHAARATEAPLSPDAATASDDERA
jgi:TrmH family RNA methyltransferase